MSFALLNVQSINNKCVTVCNLITDGCIDVFAVTETWHTASTDQPLQRAAPPGYVIFDAHHAWP